MKYKISDNVVTTDKKSGIIQNTKNGNRLLVSDEVLSLLGFFLEPKKLDDVLLEFIEEDREGIKTFLEELIEEGMLVVSQQLDSEFKWSEISDRAMVERPMTSFFSCPIRDIHDIDDEDIVFVGVPFDLGTTGYPGARFAPDKIRDISSSLFEYHADIFSGKTKGWFSANENKIVLKELNLADIGNVLLNVGEDFESFYNRVSSVLDIILESKAFPVVIGGDHSISYSVIRSLSKKYDSGVSIIHIDAHTDLGDLVPDISNNHGNVFSRVMKEELINGLHQFGIRGCIGEKNSSDNYSMYSLAQIKSIGLDETISCLDRNEKYYLSIDIDVLDPSIAPATGTPSPNGMTQDMLYDLLFKVASTFNIVGFDLVEVNPMMETDDRTSNLAHDVIFHVLKNVFK